MIDPEIPVEGWDECLNSLSDAIKKSGGDWNNISRNIRINEMTVKELLRILAHNHIRFVFEKPIGQISFYSILFLDNGRIAIEDDFDAPLNKIGGWIRTENHQIMWSTFSCAAEMAKFLQENHFEIFGKKLKLAIISLDRAYNILGKAVV